MSLDQSAEQDEMADVLPKAREWRDEWVATESHQKE
jgi:hypothetical protein